MTSPTHNLYLPDESAHASLVASHQDSLARHRNDVEMHLRALRQLGIDVAESFPLDNGIILTLPPGADKWTREEREAAHATIVQAGDGVLRGVW